MQDSCGGATHEPAADVRTRKERAEGSRDTNIARYMEQQDREHLVQVVAGNPGRGPGGGQLAAPGAPLDDTQDESIRGNVSTGCSTGLPKEQGGSSNDPPRKQGSAPSGSSQGDATTTRVHIIRHDSTMPQEMEVNEDCHARRQEGLCYVRSRSPTRRVEQRCVVGNLLRGRCETS